MELFQQCSRSTLRYTVLLKTLFLCGLLATAWHSNAGGSCGNAFLDPNEACDDGNLLAGDGCSVTCQVENGFSCTSPFQPLDTNNLVQDPGFEEGVNGVFWADQSDSTFPPNICTVNSCPEGPGARTGTHWLRLGGEPANIAQTNWNIFQPVTILPNFRFLRFEVINSECSFTGGGSAFSISLNGVQVWQTDSTDPECFGEQYRTITIDLETAPGGPWDTGNTVFLQASGTAFNDDLRVSFDNFVIAKPTSAPIPSLCTLDYLVQDYIPFENISADLGAPDFFQQVNGAGLKWVTTADGLCGGNGIPGPGNYTGEAGDAACIDSSALPSDGSIIETFFCADPIDLTDRAGTSITFTANYQPRSVSRNDFFGVWVGSEPVLGPLIPNLPSQQLLTNEPIGSFGQSPGQTFTFFPSGIDGKEEVFICFGYGNTADGIGYAQVDTVLLTSQGCLDDYEEDKLQSCFDNCSEVPNPFQRDSDNDGIGNACDPDIARAISADRIEGGNGNDCIVNFFDFFVLNAASFSTPESSNWNPDADFNEDNVVNFLDIAIFADYFLLAPGPSGISTVCNAPRK